MGRLFDRIRAAVKDDRFLVSWHADERCEERGVSDWQVVVGLDEAELVRERPRSKPYPSVVVRETLTDGSEVEGFGRVARTNLASETGYGLFSRLKTNVRATRE